MGKKKAKKVLVIGWDAADWKVMMPLIHSGKMPTLKGMMENGVWGNIATLDPPLSPMLWTSMATGVRADKHGILGFVEPLPDGTGIRPVTTTSRKVKAIWNMLNQEGYKSNVVSWWPSNPAEPINGVMVSNFYQNAVKPLDEEWPMPDGTVHPESMAEELKKLRVHPAELTGTMLMPFVPNMKDDVDLRKQKRSLSVGKILAHAASVHGAATHVMRKTEWDFMAVYHDAIDHFSHLAMKFHPPRREFIDEKDYEDYKQVVESGYRFHDMMLERYLDLVGEETTVILVSDHGFHSDHLRPMSIPKEPAGPAVEHSPFGAICMMGPGIKSTGERIFGASILDLTPTILSLYGLPIGKDMEGKPLLDAFESPEEPEFIDSWEKRESGETGQHASEKQEDPWEAQQAMKQLIELGYIEDPGEDKQEAIENTRLESQYYLARNLINANKYNEAIEILEDIYGTSKVPRYGQRLAFAYLATMKYTKCRSLIDDLRVVEKEVREKAKEEQKEKAETQEETERLDNLNIEEPLYLDFIEGLLLLSQNKTSQAYDLLNKVRDKSPGNVEVNVNIGKINLLRKRWTDAEHSFIQALSVDDANAEAHYGLGVAYLRMDRFEEAANELLIAIEHRYYYPQAHYHLGETLAKLQKYDHAAEAFSVAATMSPGMTKAHKWLVELYENQLKDPEKAQKHKDFVMNNIKGEIVIVSGLPRSGTSMMMQMLKNGGMDILTDEEREADESNPKGYLEFEKVKMLAMDKSWLEDASGKAVKVIAQLLHHLPQNYNYKIIFMERDLDEVLVSQQKMLGKDPDPNTIPLGLYTAFQKQLEKMDTWVESQPKVEMVKVKYKDVISDPQASAESIAAFLGKDLDIEGMTGAVDSKLYRNRVEEFNS